MKKIGIFYGSSTGYTADVAARLAGLLGVPMADVHDVAKTAPSELGKYDVLLLGSSTWGSGELEDDWYDFLDGAKALSLTGKKIALFGCGDVTMTGTFCGALRRIYDALKDSGAVFIAPFDADGYGVTESPAIVEGKWIGLALDEVNHSDLTDARLARWAQLVEKEM